MKAVGIKVIGYVPTKYGARALASVKSDIDSWVTFYPDIVGINFDEFATSAGQEVYYDTINKYAKSKGLSLTVGNPGAPTPTTYDGLVDIITIYESSGLPPISTLSVMKAGFTKSKLGYLAHSTPVFDTVAFATTLPFVSYCYVTNDVMRNPWDTLPSYFGAQITALDTGVIVLPNPTPIPPINTHTFTFSGTGAM